MHGDAMTEAAERFAHGSGAGSAGRMIAVPNEVFSYNERVAFRDDDGVVYVTKEKFSVTTSKHVAFVRRALSRAGYVTDGEELDGWEVWRSKRRR